jgi:hypothetical protein
MMSRPDLEDLSHRYAAAVDAWDGRAVAALFTADGRLVVHAPPPIPVTEHVGAESISARIDALRRYQWTRHEVGAHASETSDEGDTAAGVTECTAHHVGGEAGDGMDRVARIRYLDRYALVDGEWRFAERAVHIDRDEVVPFEG